MRRLIDIAAYVGAASMAAAPWSGDMMLPALITGLVLITPQAIYLRAWNLVVLNLSGIIGYLWRLI